MAGSPDNRRRLFILLILAIFATSVVATKATQWLTSPDKEITDTDTRKNLLASVKTPDNSTLDIVPVSSLNYSRLIFDFTVDDTVSLTLPLSKDVTADPTGTRRLTWRLKLTVPATFKITAGDGAEGYELSVENRSGTPLYHKSEAMTVPSEEIELRPDIYILKASSTVPLTTLALSFTKRLEDRAARNALKELNTFTTVYLNFGDSSIKDLKRLVSLGQASTDGNIVKMPGGRVKATLIGENTKNRFKARVGLSGRTREHLMGFPSIDVKVKGGGSFMGIPSFKLYRLKTKSGMNDFTFLSVLKDMGFFVPRQEIVTLNVNGESRGLYLLMETQNPAIFTNQKLLEGSILGVGPTKLFFDYPYGADIDLKYFYRPRDGAGDKEEKGFFLSSDFTKSLDDHATASYLAFASTYYAAHGLGVDDLRFYKNPVTNLYSPIPRDLNPGVWNLRNTLRSYLTHTAWSPNSPLYTVWPVKKLLEKDYEFNRGLNIFDGLPVIATSTGVTDLHFALSTFTSGAGGLGLANRYLDYYAKDDSIKAMLRRRALNASVMILSDGREHGIVRNQSINYRTKGVLSLGEISGHHILNDGIRLSDGKRSYFWNIRTSKNMREGLGPSFMAPLAYDITPEELENQYKLSFFLDKKVFSILDGAGVRGIKKSFVAVEGADNDGGEALLTLTPLPNKTVPVRKGTADLQEIANVVTHLSTIASDDRAMGVVLFLVRNATGDISDYALSLRDSFTRIKPVINSPFSVYGGTGKVQANLKQIMSNHLLIGEGLRLLAFEVPLARSAQFYSLIVPDGARIFFPPYMYLPAAKNIYKRHGGGPEEDVLPAGIEPYKDGFKIPEGRELLLTEDLIIPDGKALYVGEGVTVRLAPGVSVKVTGSFIVNGTPSKPVSFESAGTLPWGGLYIAGSTYRKVDVKLKNTVFNNYGSFPKTVIAGEINLNGGVTFYNAGVSMEGVKFLKAASEDALNIISSDAVFKDVSVLDAYSDAVDLDFSYASIDGLKITGSRGDGLDISFSLIKCVNSKFMNSADKGLSIGEGSMAYVERSVFSGNAMGIANKDQSRVNVSNSVFEGNGIALAEFIKKPYFGKPSSLMTDNIYKGNKERYRWLDFYSY